MWRMRVARFGNWFSICAALEWRDYRFTDLLEREKASLFSSCTTWCKMVLLERDQAKPSDFWASVVFTSIFGDLFWVWPPFGPESQIICLTLSFKKHKMPDKWSVRDCFQSFLDVIIYPNSLTVLVSEWVGDVFRCCINRACLWLLPWRHFGKR